MSKLFPQATQRTTAPFRFDIVRNFLSPQCGFASTEEGNILTEEQQWAKLAFIRDIVEDVWGK